MIVEGRKKRGSRKTKKGWRTLTDTTDVESFLDDKRVEERLGTPFKERRDEELFVIDTTATPSKKARQPVKSKKARRQALLKKPPQCFQALVPDSAVPDPLKKRNRVLSKAERKHPLLVQREERRKLLGIKTAKELGKERNRAYDQERRNNKPKKGEFKEDPWNDNGKKDSPIESEWLNPVTKTHIKKHSKDGRKTVPSTLRTKSSVVPAVEPPHPGASYNPTFEDHQNLLRQVATKEEELIAKDKHLTRVTAPMLTLMDRRACEAMKLAELSQGTPLLDPAAAVKDEPSDEEGSKLDDKTGLVKINPTTSREKKKDLKKRRNIREERLKQALIRLKKSEKKKTTDLDRLKFIKEEVDQKKQEEEEVKKKREELIKTRVGRTKRLGRNKYTPLEADFILPSQMQSGLLRLAPQGSILADRFNSLQKRNVMEVSKRQKLANPKKKKVFKKAEQKMPWEATNYKAPKRSAPRETKADWEF